MSVCVVRYMRIAICVCYISCDGDDDVWLLVCRAMDLEDVDELSLIDHKDIMSLITHKQEVKTINYALLHFN